MLDKLPALLAHILNGLTVDSCERIWKNRTVQKVRFSKESYEALRVNDEFMLVRVPKETR